MTFGKLGSKSDLYTQPREPLFVLADTRDRAEHFARSRGVDRPNLRYIGDEWALQGIEGDGRTLYVYGYGRTRKDFRRCIDIAQIRRFTIEFIAP